MVREKINITYIIDYIGWAGAQTHFVSIIENINYNKFNVSVICLRNAGLRFSILENYPVKTLVCDLENLMNPLKTIKAYFKLKRFLKENDTDVFHSYMFNPNLIASLVSYFPGKKYKLITTRRDTGYWHQRHHWWLYSFMNVVTDKVIAVSSDVRLESIKHESLSPKKIITIYNGVNTDLYSKKCVDGAATRKKFNFSENDFIVGILAALRPEKRHDLFIQAASKVVESIPNVKFLIVGGGYKDTEDKIDKLIKEYKLENKFILTGSVLDVAPVLTCFDLSILCSDTEGMSNTVLQSISMGIATIVTDVGGNPEVITHNENGIIIPPNSADELANEIINLYNDNDRRLKLAQNARISAVERFNIAPIIASLEDVYTEIVTQ